MAKKKIDLSEKDLEVSSDAKKALLDIYLDEGNVVKNGDSDYLIKGLTPYSRMLICRCLERIPSDGEQELSSLIKIGGDTMEYACEITSICICNRKFTEDTERNQRLIKETSVRLALETEDISQWYFILLAAVKTFAFDLGVVFQISSLAKATCSMPMRKNPMIVEQSQFMQPRS